MKNKPFRCALGLDVGGTRARFALVALDGENAMTLCDNHVAGFNGLMLASEGGAEVIEQRIAEIAAHLRAGSFAQPEIISAGISGYDATDARATKRLKNIFSSQLHVAETQIHLANDVECAYNAYFARGEGYLVYAGTGSIAVFIDEYGIMHQAGGRGGMIGDEGAAFSITVTALREIWRREDEAPDAWRNDVLAQKLLGAIGGTDWNHTRQLTARNDRGEIGMLARVVADAAREGDGYALSLLQRAGSELARLARALVARYGELPIGIAGGTFRLHPAIEASFRDALSNLDVQPRKDLPFHTHAAERALWSARGDSLQSQR
jgi:glucosamine kinase